MNRTIGLAALLGLLATAPFASRAAAQCGSLGSGMLIGFQNGDVFAYETNYNNATYSSTIGSQLTVVGIINSFCAPLDNENATDPSKEYTFVWTLTALTNTATSPFGTSGTKYDTDYGNGTFVIYEGSPRNAPTAATLGSFGPPPNAVVPPNYLDGSLVLSGQFLNPLHVTVTRSSLNNWSGSFNGQYFFTGGADYGKVGGATSNINGLWCPAYVTGTGNANGRCSLPSGYSAHPNGKWDSPSSTPATHTTWGAIQALYR